jgi:hypothetical protein
MTAAELKAAWELLVAEAAKTPDDAALKTKVEAAKAAYDAKVAQDAAAAAAGSNPDDLDLDKADEKTKAYILKLRKENGKYRTDAKDAKSKLDTVTKALGLTGDETPEAKAQRLSASNETIAFENAVLANAIEHGVPKDSMKFFKYLLAEAAQELKDGEELADDNIAALAVEAKAKSVKPAATTTVVPAAGGTGTPSPASGTAALTVEQFAALGFNEKCKLYEKDPTQYESLFKQAAAKRLVK